MYSELALFGTMEAC